MALQYARENFLQPIFVHPQHELKMVDHLIWEGYDVEHIIPGEFLELAHEKGFKKILPVYNTESLEKTYQHTDNCIVQIEQSEISKLSALIIHLFENTERINLNVTNLDGAFDEKLYQDQLDKIKDYLVENLRSPHTLKELNVLTDLCFLSDHDNCGAGNKSFAVGPDCNLYVCAGFYKKGGEFSIGNVRDGITRANSERLYAQSAHPICRDCDAYQCVNCVYLNHNATNEVNVSPSYQCRKAHIERRISSDLLKELQEDPLYSSLVENRKIEVQDYLDPIHCFFKNAGKNIGYYKYQK